MVPRIDRLRVFSLLTVTNLRHLHRSMKPQIRFVSIILSYMTFQVLTADRHQGNNVDDKRQYAVLKRRSTPRLQGATFNLILSRLNSQLNTPHSSLNRFQPRTENIACRLQITTYAIYNVQIIICAIHLSIYEFKICMFFSSSNTEQLCGGSLM
jgi:hypothetical protein